MTDGSMKALGGRMLVAVTSYVARSMSQITARIEDFEKRMDSIPAGPQGPPGVDGKDGGVGIPGKDGANGAVGLAGKDGANGLAGKDGAAGRDGREGRDGADGFDGAPGRDALELDVLSAIDTTKSYQRGTFASYKGGIIRALRNTDAVTSRIEEAGWQVIVEGVCEVQLRSEDERTTKLAFVLTSGRCVEHELRLPVMIYRGLWQEGQYTRGDAVTRDGGVWHCDCDTTEEPGLSTHWTLAAKRGRNGKDGVNGERGERGPTGRAGRDYTNLGART